MVVGMNEKLEKMMVNFKEKDDDVDFSDVMNCVVDSVAAGDLWHVPVEVMEDGMNETDFNEGWILEKLPAFYKKTLRTGEDEELFGAYTSEAAVNKTEEEGTLMTVKYPARELLRELVKADDCPGLLINPWSDSFFISRENAEKVLQNAEKIPAEGVRNLPAYRIEPRAMIDTNAILNEWKENWHDDDGTQEAWELESYPIMADGRVLLLFAMRDEIYGGKYDTFKAIHTHSHYRVLEYEMTDGELRLKNRYRFKAQDAHVGTVFLYDGILRATISVEGKNDYKVLSMVPVNDDTQFSIYGAIETVSSNSKGDIIVAYNHNLRDEARCPLMAFDTEGNAIQRYRDEWALYCSEVNIDQEESIWFHMYPSTTIDRLVPGTNTVETHKVEVQGFSSFALSSDMNKLFVSFPEYGGGSVQYIMTADKNGNYGNPIRFDFRPKDAEGNVLEVKDCDTFGRASTTKSWVILNADGILYLYDIDDCCE